MKNEQTLFNENVVINRVLGSYAEMGWKVDYSCRTMFQSTPWTKGVELTYFCKFKPDWNSVSIQTTAKTPCALKGDAITIFETTKRSYQHEFIFDWNKDGTIFTIEAEDVECKDYYRQFDCEAFCELIWSYVSFESVLIGTLVYVTEAYNGVKSSKRRAFPTHLSPQDQMQFCFLNHGACLPN